MKQLVCALFLLNLFGCSPTPSDETPTDQHVVAGPESTSSLIEVSAGDFYRNTSQSMQFRGVRSGYELTPDSVKQFLICGEFKRLDDGSDGAWSRFATIRTDGYEQWLGAQASGLCDRASIVWEEEDGLSGQLESAFEELQELEDSER